jgi:hypothetical protein
MSLLLPYAFLPAAVLILNLCCRTICPALLEFVFIIFEFIHFRKLASLRAELDAKQTQILGELLLVQSRSKFQVYAFVGQHEEMEVLWFQGLHVLCRKRGPMQEAIAEVAKIIKRYEESCKALNADSKAAILNELGPGTLSELARVPARKRKSEVMEQKQIGKSKSRKSAKPPKPPKPSNGASGSALPMIEENQAAGETVEGEGSPSPRRTDCYSLRSLTKKRTEPQAGLNKRKADVDAGEDSRRKLLHSAPQALPHAPLFASTAPSQHQNSQFSTEAFSEACGTDSISSERSPLSEASMESIEGTTPWTGVDDGWYLSHLQQISYLAAHGLEVRGSDDFRYDSSAVSLGWDRDAENNGRKGLVSQRSTLHGWTSSPERGGGMLMQFFNELEQHVSSSRSQLRAKWCTFPLLRVATSRQVQGWGWRENSLCVQSVDPKEMKRPLLLKSLSRSFVVCY